MEKHLGSTLPHFLLATLFVLCFLSDLMSRVQRRGVARVLAVGQAGHGHAQWGSGCCQARGAGLLLPPRSLSARSSRAAASGQRPRRSPPRTRGARPLQPVLSCRPPEGATKRQPVVRPVPVYQLSAPQGSAAPARARKVEHAGSLGRAWRLARRPAIAGRARAAGARRGGGRPGRSPGFF